MKKQEHISEERFDKFVISADLLDKKEREFIENHIEHCQLCRDYYIKIQDFYRELEQRLRTPPGEKDRELAHAVLRKRSRGLLPSKSLEEKRFESLVKTYTDVAVASRRSLLPQRLFYFVQAHPVASTAVMFAMAAILSFTFLFYQKSGDVNPAYALVENYQLKVYNQDGELLWSKPALGIPDLSSIIWKRAGTGSKRFLMVDDIDGNGFNEVLLLRSVGYEITSDTLVCFNYDGALRWKGELPAPVVYGNKEQTRFVNWEMRDFISMRKSKNHNKQLFVITTSRLNPSTLFELNPLDGTLLQTYWHNGHINHLLPFDVNSDGNMDLLIGGINNPYENAFISVLDPHQISGYGPTTQEDIPRNVRKAQEKFYILFPKSSVSQTWNTVRYNSTALIEITSGTTLSVHVNELPGRVDSDSGGVIYVIDDSMRVVNVTHNAPFRAIHRRLVDEGILNDTLDADYWNNLKNSVRYWDGEQFVNEPVMNRWYGERMPS